MVEDRCSAEAQPRDGFNSAARPTDHSAQLIALADIPPRSTETLDSQSESSTLLRCARLEWSVSDSPLPAPDTLRQRFSDSQAS